MDGMLVGASQAMPAYDNYREKLVSMPTLKDRLEAAVVRAQAQLDAVQEARAIFERNPDIERLLDLMQKSHF
jgi:hypothetical protein